MRETEEETGISLRGQKHIACHKLSVGEYYFFEMDNELMPFVGDNAEVEEARWFALDEIKKMSCNVDVNHFVERIYRGQRKAAIRKLEQSNLSDNSSLEMP